MQKPRIDLTDYGINSSSAVALAASLKVRLDEMLVFSSDGLMNN